MVSRLDAYRRIRRIDYLLGGLALVLCLIGLAMIASASAVISFERFGYTSYYVVRQAVAFLIGAVVMMACSTIDYQKWRQWSIGLMILAIVSLVAVFIPGLGVKLGGAHRWINVGPILIQPAELVKLALVIYLASWLDTKGKKIVKDFRQGLVPFFIILGIVALLIIKQPDLGTVVIIGLTSVSLFYVAGASLAQLVAVAVVIMLSLLSFIKSAPYRLQRFLTFLNPSSDRLGAGYQINQSLIAIGSGGWLGLGFGQSRQKYLYLPQPHIDSIFAIMTEELGFLRVIIVIALFSALTIRCFKVAKNAPDQFGQLLASGISLWIVYQFFINIGAITHLVPLTGVPLPFISYGGSALVALMAGIGILLNISKHAKE